MVTLVKAYNICVTMVAQGHRHQLSIPPFFSPSELSFWPYGANFWVLVRFKFFLEPINVDNQFCFGNTALSFCFLFSQIWGLFCIFWALRGYLFGPLGLFWVEVRFKNIFGTSNVDYQFLFWKYSPIFLF